MRKIKTVAVFAIIGFVLSFVFGLFSRKGIGLVFLTALVFAIVFALLGFIIELLFTKVLLEDSNSDLQPDVPINSNNSDSEKKGQIIDFTVQDEELPQGTSSNHFVVNENHQILNETDVQNSKEEDKTSENEETSVDNGFKPLKNKETINNFSSKESFVPSSLTSLTENDNSEGIDVLPNLDDFNFNTKSTEETGSSNETYGDSDSSFSSSFSSSQSKTPEDVGIQDAALMAKAISSALSNDES